MHLHLNSYLPIQKKISFFSVAVPLQDDYYEDDWWYEWPKGTNADHLATKYALHFLSKRNSYPNFKNNEHGLNFMKQSV